MLREWRVVLLAGTKTRIVNLPLNLGAGSLDDGLGRGHHLRADAVSRDGNYRVSSHV
jgi:hypothetical protein